MMTETNREIIWLIGVITLINLGLSVYNATRIAKVLGGNSSHPMDYTVAAIANVDNRGLERRDSNISMGPMRDAKS